MRRIDSYTLNKIAGWILGTSLLVFGLNALAEVVYHAEAPEQPGMVVEVAAQTPAADGSQPGEAGPSIAALLADADPEGGQAAARACQACHNFDQGGPNLTGPNLWNVVGRQIASAEGYTYSDALQARSAETWSYEALNDFIHNPRGFAPGTKMAYGGMPRDEQRADLLAYLRTLSEDPQPLPEPAAEATQDAAATEETGEPAAPAAAEGAAPAEAPQQTAETQETGGAEPAGEAAEGEAPAEAPQQTAQTQATEGEPAGETNAEGAAGGISELIAEIDPEQGKAAARACQACHTFEEGGAHRVGPNLWGIVGRPIAQAEGYAYSDALQGKSGETWTLEALNEFILNPRGFAPGTKMAYGGMKRDEQRLQLLAYLRTLGANP